MIREWQPTLVFLPEEFHGQRSLEGYSPWGRKESDMTERITHTQGMVKVYVCVYIYIFLPVCLPIKIASFQIKLRYSSKILRNPNLIN